MAPNKIGALCYVTHIGSDFVLVQLSTSQTLIVKLIFASHQKFNSWLLAQTDFLSSLHLAIMASAVQ